MKFCVFGAGAIGGYLGVQLARAGQDVTLIARGEKLKAIRQHGMKLLIDGEERVAKNVFATDDTEEAGPQDYVIIATKDHQAYEAAHQIPPLLGPDTPVVTAQNDVPWWYFYKLGNTGAPRTLDSVDREGLQWKTIGPERAIGCVVYPGGRTHRPLRRQARLRRQVYLGRTRRHDLRTHPEAERGPH